jgi:uncharacterized protein (TIGR02145 family)
MDGNMKGVILLLFLFSFSFYESFAQKEEMKTVKIGNQVWMAKNLDVVTFRNGDFISQAKDSDQWDYAANNKMPVWCYYEFDKNNGKFYGKLYNWYAVNDSRGLAPMGFHVPSIDEFNILSTYFGGDTKAGKSLKYSEGWLKNGNGDNSSGLAFLPGGDCNGSGFFEGLGNYGYWWSSTYLNSGYAFRYRLESSNSKFSKLICSKYCGFSVRCIKD